MTFHPLRFTVVVMVLIVLVWSAAYPLAQYLPAGFFSGPFEPAYNGLNVLFTALAFGGVVVTLFFQVEEAGIARREEIERSIFELFLTFSSPDFQRTKDGAFRVLLAAVQSREYAEFLASRLFVVDQIAFPDNDAVRTTLQRLDTAKQGLDTEALIQADRADRLMLDNMLNFFAMLAQRKSSVTVIKHCDFAYDWWRPVLWLVAQLQFERYQASEVIPRYCKNPLAMDMLKVMDAIYGHPPLNTSAEVWAYLRDHPKLQAFGLDPRFTTAAPRG